LRRYVIPVLCAVAVSVVVGADLARARPYDTFTLEQYDKLIAETPGCYSSCTVQGTRRTCTLKEFDCKVVCSTIPECKPDGFHPMKACAVIRETANR
jgi:hypothetical protein